MINKSGGSSHDPDAKLPPAMWDRTVSPAGRECGRCARSQSGPSSSPLYAVPAEPNPSSVLAAAGGTVVLALVCRHCDGVGLA